MAWFESKTVFVSTSLFCLPVIALCAILSLPLVILVTASLYLSAWAIYLGQHLSQEQTSMHLVHHLPTHPTAVLDINSRAFHLMLAWISYIPSLVLYIKWRYWTIGHRRFPHIIQRGLPYSSHDPSICKLDMYYPDMDAAATTAIDGNPATTTTPVIVFVCGRDDPQLPRRRIFYTPYANTFRELGYIVAVPDYRPGVDAGDDIKEAIRWVYRHVSALRYESDMLYVMGHGSGAKLALELVLDDVFSKAKCHKLPTSSQVSDMSNEKHDPSADYEQQVDEEAASREFLPGIEGLILFACAYRDRALGMIKEHRELFETSCDLVDFFPRILLLHGDKDQTVSSDQATDMYNVLGEVLPADRRVQVDVRMRLYRKLDHTRCITALMPRMTSLPDKLQKNLVKEIQEFIDLPPGMAAA